MGIENGTQMGDTPDERGSPPQPSQIRGDQGAVDIPMTSPERAAVMQAF